MAVVLGSSLTTAEKIALLESEHLFIDAGCELLDADDVLIEDISGDLVVEGSSVSRGIYNTLHGSCRLRISRELLWGSQRLRPYLLVSNDAGRYESSKLTDDAGVPLTDDDGAILSTGESGVPVEATWYRWNLGVFLPSVPERNVGESPAVFEVDGFDKLDVLNQPLDASITIGSGAPIVASVEALIAAAGESKVNLDPSSAVTASVRVYSLMEDWTTLTVCNDLLASIGYQALWVDRDGWFRSTPYVSPEDRATVWTYNADSDSSTVGEMRSSVADYFQAANVVLGVNDNPELTTPVIGNGLYRLTNQSDGETSIDARGGREIVRVVRGSYASQSALETAVTAALDAEKRVANYVRLTVAPNPIHGHFDVVRLVDSAMPVDGRFLVTDWELPLDGSDMSLALRGV